MPKKQPIFDYTTCMACGICDQACPSSCISLTRTDIDKYKKAYPALIEDSQCTGCGICQKVCPIDSIQMKEIIS